MLEVLANVCHQNDIQATPFLAIIRPPVSGGRKHRNNNANRIIAACRRWEVGDILGLWSEAVNQKRERKFDLHTSAVFRRAKCLASEGRMGSACAALISDPLAFSRLLEKHPTGKRVELSDFSPEHLEVTSSSVMAQLRSFPKGTASGPSGLSAQHLLDAIFPGEVTVINALTSVVQLLVAGLVPMM